MAPRKYCPSFSKPGSILVSLVLLSAPFLGFAQNASVPPSSVIHVSSQLVVLDVVVTGKDGKLIPGLTKDDFHIFEEGELQKIRSFQYAASASASSSHSRSVLILDELNNSIEETSYAKSELDHYIATQPEILLQPTMLVALDDDGLRKLVSSTRDRHALEQALHAESSKIPSDFLRHDNQARFRTSLNALWQIAHSMEDSSGRTELIWVGHGFPSLNLSNVEGEYIADMQKLVQNVSNALLNARAVLYKIDAAPVGAGNMNPSMDNFDAAIEDTVAPFSDSISFDTLVHQTGGRTFFNRNDVDAEIARAVDLGGTFYTLSYTPAHTASPDETYRHIHVAIDRAGAHAATRLGYFTAPPSSTPASGSTLDAAITSDLDYNALKIVFQNCAATNCKLQIDTRNLSWVADPSGSSHASFVACAASYSATHKPLSYNRAAITLNAGSSEALPQQASFDIPLRIPAEANSFRFVVLDTVTGKLGSINVTSNPGSAKATAGKSSTR